MKLLFKFSSLGINPIYRDLTLVVLAGLMASMAIVTMGYMVASQF
jgi:hypothetical protein